VASEVGVDNGLAFKKSISSLLLSKDEIVRTRITGKGWCVVQSPIAASDVLRIDLVDQELRVDGDIVLFRKGQLDQKVSGATGDIPGLVTSGEGLVNVFRGTGQVWLAPAEHGYEQLIDLLQRAGMPYGPRSASPTRPRRTLEELIS